MEIGERCTAVVISFDNDDSLRDLDLEVSLFFNITLFDLFQIKLKTYQFNQILNIPENSQNVYSPPCRIFLG